MWTAEQQGIVSPFTPFLFRALVVSLAFLLLLHTLARYRDQLIKVSARRETLEQIAFIDPLTNLPNRRQIYDTLTRVSVQIQIDMQPCSLVIWDIDHFKQINDTLGHPVGDSVLHQVAVLGRTQIRQDDLLGRWGGEEFMLVLPNTALDVAQTCAERLCRALAEHHILPEQRVTASFGVTEMQPAETIEACIQRADEALYLAKQRGRNCVCVLPAGIRQNEFLPVL
jgi:diguanylate cyclase (GGDEF)-like protein